MRLVSRRNRLFVRLFSIDLGGDTTGNGVSKLAFTILSAVAEAERNRTRERIAEVKADQRRRGRFLGGSVAFGWRREGAELVPVPEQRAAIKRMRKMHASGCVRSATGRRRMGAGVSHVAVANALKAGG